MQTVASQVDISKALQIGGWMSQPELTWLATQAKKHLYIVEFGCLHGRSTRALADNVSEKGKIWAVDPWDGNYYDEGGNNFNDKFSTYVYPYFRKNLLDHIKSGVVIPHRGYSYDFTLPFKVDMVFLDGDHRKGIVAKDIKVALNLLRPGGLICGHDYGHSGWPGVKEDVDSLLEDVKIEDTIWYTTKS